MHGRPVRDGNNALVQRAGLHRDFVASAHIPDLAEPFTIAATQRPSGRAEDGAKIATVQLAADGSGWVFASATFTARSGTHPIVAVYQGDGTYTAATSNTVPLAGS